MYNNVISYDNLLEVFKKLNYYCNLCINYELFKSFVNEYIKVSDYISKWNKYFNETRDFSKIEVEDITIVKNILDNIKLEIIDMDANDGYFYHDDLYTWIDILDNYKKVPNKEVKR